MITRWQKKLKKQYPDIVYPISRAKFCNATNVQKPFAPNENTHTHTHTHTHKSQLTNETKHNSAGTSVQNKFNLCAI